VQDIKIDGIDGYVALNLEGDISVDEIHAALKKSIYIFY